VESGFPVTVVVTIGSHCLYIKDGLVVLGHGVSDAMLLKRSVALDVFVGAFSTSSWLSRGKKKCWGRMLSYPTSDTMLCLVVSLNKREHVGGCIDYFILFYYYSILLRTWVHPGTREHNDVIQKASNATVTQHKNLKYPSANSLVTKNDHPTKKTSEICVYCSDLHYFVGISSRTARAKGTVITAAAVIISQFV